MHHYNTLKAVHKCFAGMKYTISVQDMFNQGSGNSGINSLELYADWSIQILHEKCYGQIS